jgi:hypothetical protein
VPYGIDYPEQIYALSSQPARSYFSDILKSAPEAHARRQSRALQAETEIFLRLSCFDIALRLGIRLGIRLGHSIGAFLRRVIHGGQAIRQLRALSRVSVPRDQAFLIFSRKSNGSLVSPRAGSPGTTSQTHLYHH